MLDVDLGTYPFVTSSNTTAGGTAVGTGFGPRYLDYVLGITKAYATRVGSGPFPTELFDDVGAGLAERGRELVPPQEDRDAAVGSTVALRQAVQVNSISGLCLTKLDVLDGLETIKICVGYDSAGSGQWSKGPMWAVSLRGRYTNLRKGRGWQDTTLGIRAIKDLPAAARRYICVVEEAVGAPVDIISTGPDRNETILLNDPFGDVDKLMDAKLLELLVCPVKGALGVQTRA